MPPGPTEPTAEQLQHYLKLIVDDLLDLYDPGIRITTAEYPEGMRIHDLASSRLIGS